MDIQPHRDNDRVVMTVHMRIHSEETLDELSDSGLESLWEFDTCNSLARIREMFSDTTQGRNRASNIYRYTPTREGNSCSLLMWSCTQDIRCSMYSGAGSLVGCLYFLWSCQRYSNLFFFCARKIRPICKLKLCRATGVNCEGTYSFDVFIVGHVTGEQNSAIDPYYIQAVNLKTMNSKYIYMTGRMLQLPANLSGYRNPQLDVGVHVSSR